ncbi:response regulator [Rhizobium sp. PAMB 3182]
MTSDGPEVQSLSADVMKAVFDGTAMAVILCDKNDHIAFVGPQITNFFPLSDEIMKGGVRLRDFLGAIYDSRPTADWRMANGDAALSRAEWVAERLALHWRERYETEEGLGNGRWIRWTKRRLANGYGVAVIVDVSEDHNREEQWRADLERVQLTEEILDSFPFPLCVKDKDLIYVAANRAFCRLQGRSPEELIGRHVSDFLPLHHAEIIDAADRYVMDSGTAHNQHQRLLSAEGHELPVLARKIRVGKPGRYLLVTVLEDLSDFLTPDGIARKGAFKLDVDWPRIDNSGMTRADPAIWPIMDGGDGSRLKGRKILLVGCGGMQAIAIEQLGAMEAEACCVDTLGELELFLDMAANCGVRIDIVVVNSDLGIEYLEMAENFGIPAIGCDLLQFDANLPSLVARHFCNEGNAAGEDLDDGDWEISTDAGTGGAEVLVVEDNEVNRIVFRHLLEGIGCAYVLAGDGVEAVSLWNEHRPSLVLMDISLPDIDGFEACRQIRVLEEGEEVRTPIIGVLAHVSESDERRCMEAGMDGSICKPLSPAVIAGLLAQYGRRDGFSATG